MDKLMGKFASLSAKTEASEARILSSANARMDAVRARIDEIRPHAVIDDAKGKEYIDLIQERAQLESVIRLGNLRASAAMPSQGRDATMSA